MIYYYSDQLKNYILQLKRRITEQTGQVYERDLVNDIRKYWYRGKSHYVKVLCGLKGTGKTTGLLQAVENFDDTVYILAQPEEDINGQDYIEFLKTVKQKNIIIDNYNLIKGSPALSRYLNTLTENGKRIAIAGTSSLTLNYPEDAEPAHKTESLNVNLFTYKEFCGIYQKEHTKESFAEFLKTGGLFKSQGVNDFSSMALYIKKAVIDELSAYYPAEEIKTIVYTIMYLSVSDLNLTQDTYRLLQEDENYRNVMTAVNSKTEIDPVKFDFVAEKLEKANFIVKTYNMHNQEEFRFHLVTPMFAYQTARLVYGKSSECEKQAFEAYTASYMTAYSRQEDYLWYLDMRQLNGEPDLEFVIVNTDDELAYLFDLKPRETLPEDSGLLSGELGKALGCLEVGGRFITGNYPEDKCELINRKRVIFATPDSETLQYYREFNKTYHQLRRGDNGKKIKREFVRKEFGFPIPDEVEKVITELENAVLSNSTQHLEGYCLDIKLFALENIGENGFTQMQAFEVIEYYSDGNYFKK